MRMSSFGFNDGKYLGMYGSKNVLLNKGISIFNS